MVTHGTAGPSAVLPHVSDRKRSVHSGMRTFLRLLVIGLLATPSALAADLGITPPRLALNAPTGGAVVATVTVLTTASTDQQIAVEVRDWAMSIDGELTYLPAGSTATSAAPWLTLDADEFVLGAGDTRELRIEARIPEGAEGTHHAMVFFTVVPPPSDTPGVGVTTTTRIGLTVYVTVVGTERPGAELVDLYRPDDATLAAVVVNTGNTVMRLGGAVEIRDEAGDVHRVLPAPDVPVLRDSEREVRLELPDDLEPGFYVALALIEDDRGGLLAGELPFEVP